MAAPLTEIEQLKRDAKLIGSLARQLPGIDVNQARTVLELVQLEIKRWIVERQSAQDLLRQVIAQHDEARLDVKLVGALVRLILEKVLPMQTKNSELHTDTLVALEEVRAEMRSLVEELRNRTTERT
jgi:hypothetical protein